MIRFALTSGDVHGVQQGGGVSQQDLVDVQQQRMRSNAHGIDDITANR